MILSLLLNRKRVPDGGDGITFLAFLALSLLMVGEGKRRGAVLSKACGYEIGLRPVSNGRRTKTGTFGRTRNWMGLKNTSYKEM